MSWGQTKGQALIVQAHTALLDQIAKRQQAALLAALNTDEGEAQPAVVPPAPKARAVVEEVSETAEPEPEREEPAEKEEVIGPAAGLRNRKK
mmetsp:Transcript_42415/g.92233  ORF Transcript_42415/g.92233 Transcript_42415/m.92233 type:complete len:92 (-) Transcript_42415:24-299(-)